MGLDSPTHILILLVVLVLLFGSAKLPKLAKSLGESMRLFKGEVKKQEKEDDAQVQGTVQQPLPAPPPAVQQPVMQQQPAVQQQPVVQQPADTTGVAGAQPQQPTNQAG